MQLLLLSATNKRPFPSVVIPVAKTGSLIQSNSHEHSHFKLLYVSNARNLPLDVTMTTMVSRSMYTQHISVIQRSLIVSFCLKAQILFFPFKCFVVYSLQFRNLVCSDPSEQSSYNNIDREKPHILPGSLVLKVRMI